MEVRDTAAIVSRNPKTMPQHRLARHRERSEKNLALISRESGVDANKRALARAYSSVRYTARAR